MLYYNLFTLLFSDSVGIEEIIKEHINIYPNPFRDVIRLEMASPGRYEITAMDGRLLKEGRIGQKGSISLQDLAPGLYIIRLSDKNNNIYTRKIIKQHF